MRNQDVRDAVKRAGVKMWEIAEELGIGDTTLCRRLRKELPQEEKEKIFSIIEKLAQEVN